MRLFTQKTARVKINHNRRITGRCPEVSSGVHNAVGLGEGF